MQWMNLKLYKQMADTAKASEQRIPDSELDTTTQH